MHALSLLFGITSTVLSLYLKFGRRLLLKILKSEPGAKVQMPSLEEIDFFKSLIHEMYPNLPDVCCVMDGVNCCWKSYHIHECFYNGWQHDHYVSNIFVFVPNGLIIACAINNPGCMHDSLCAE